MDRKFLRERGITRRELARAGLGGAAALCTLGGIPAHSVFGRIAHAVAPPRAPNERILVVFELSGGNDGLNTLVPYGDDAYYRHRPTIGLKPDGLLRLDDHFGLNPGMVGFERLWQGRASSPSCTAAATTTRPSRTSPRWPTGRPRRPTAAPSTAGSAASRTGWTRPARPTSSSTSAIPSRSRCAAREHVPVVFDDPEHVPARGLLPGAAGASSTSRRPDGVDNPARRYLLEVARSALDASALVREAWASYRTPIDYGIVPLDLDKIAALIAADLPARLYYASFRNNAFDTHVAPERSASAAAHLRLRRDRGLHAGHGADRARRRRGAAGVLRVRPPGAGEHQPRHRPRHRRARCS